MYVLMVWLVFLRSTFPLLFLLSYLIEKSVFKASFCRSNQDFPLGQIPNDLSIQSILDGLV